MTKRGLPEQDSSFKCFRVQWTLMHAYERFEQIIVSADRAVGAQSKIRDSGFDDYTRHYNCRAGLRDTGAWHRALASRQTERRFNG